MSRLVKILALSTAVVAVAVATAACGTEKISVPKQQAQLYHGATLFNQRCSGCHTLSYAATYGSAPNVRTAQAISGPNFNQRCERPIDRVIYAIANGGFSGAYMPQNIVVGQDAIDVAKFVATYAGRQAPIQTGTVKCQNKSIGTLPPGAGTTQIASAASAGTAPSSVAAAAATVKKSSATAKKSKNGTGRSGTGASSSGRKGKASSGKSGTKTTSTTSTSGT
jgi:hypothetical protein